ncbi:MAG: tRNA (guanosine(46)-N7)-methyltransferase TrmB [Pseudomonadota bacterium]
MTDNTDPNTPSNQHDVSHPKRIKSFVLRTGRMTTGQQAAYDSGMPLFGLQLDDGLISPDSTFGRAGSLNLEIGFGMGDSLAMMALGAPNENFIGIEVHTPGVGKLLQIMQQDQIDNIRVYECDAIDVLNLCIPDHSIDRLQIYFPDPWHKTKHHKRRLINDGFLDLARQKLIHGGLIHVATDWEDYAKHCLSVFSKRDDFVNQSSSPSGYCDKPLWRPETKFERRGMGLGHSVFDLLLTSK